MRGVVGDGDGDGSRSGRLLESRGIVRSKGEYVHGHGHGHGYPKGVGGAGAGENYDGGECGYGGCRHLNCMINCGFL